MLFKNDLYLFVFVYMNLFHVCVCTMCLFGACECHKRVLNPLELEFQGAVSQHMNVRS